MASYSVTTTSQVVAPTANVWQFTHTAGSANIFLDVGAGRVEVLRPAGSVSINAAAVSARTTAGTATLDVTDYSPSWGGEIVDGGAP